MACQEENQRIDGSHSHRETGLRTDRELQINDCWHTIYYHWTSAWTDGFGTEQQNIRSKTQSERATNSLYDLLSLDFI